MALNTLKQNNKLDVIFQANKIDEIEGQDAVLQRIKNRLALWAGEFFINPEDGFDWLDVFESQPDDFLLIGALQLYLEADEHITQVIDIRITRNDRKLNISFEALSSGGIISDTVTI